VRRCHGGGWQIRLADTGGAFAAARISEWNPLPLPRAGARIQLRGPLDFDHEHRWYVIDPVEAWLEAPSPLLSR
jgi:hypothetical protein